MKKVERYQASDGQLFKNSYDCLVYERNVEACKKLTELYQLKCSKIDWGGDFADFVLDNKEEIINILIKNMRNDG